MRIGEAADRKGRREPRLTLEFEAHHGSAVLVAVIAMMIMVMVMIMAAATALAMRMVLRMVMSMGVGVTMVMLVTMLMLVAMIMVRTVIMMMIVAMMMRMHRLRIGPALGVESGLDSPYLPAEALHHRLDHVVAADAQLLPRDLNREMPVAEMPGKAQQMLRAFRADLGQRLARAHNFHHAPILELQRVARAQGDRLRQIEQEIQAAHAFHGEAAAMAIIEIEHHGIGGIAAPISPGDDFRGADHEGSPRS
jgi:hypothetical protein